MARIPSNKLTEDRFRPMCRHLGLREVTFHDMRHTYAVHFMQTGGDIYQFQRILGHKSIETTQQYLRYAPQFTEALQSSADIVHFGGESEDSGVVELFSKEKRGAG